MIKRYSREAMRKIWADESRFEKYLLIERLACEAMARENEIPKRVADKLKKVKIDIKRIEEHEKKVGHEIVAFLQQISEDVGKDSEYIHKGLTSSDVLDTALSLQLRESIDLIMDGLNELISTLKILTKKYKDTIMMGRTHGMYAEPITFGFKLAGYYSELMRKAELLKSARNYISYGKISGAVGTYGCVNPKVEEYVCKKLNLKREPISTQIIPRDRHAYYVLVLAMLASSIERIALEIRHLQRTEIGEVSEPFTKHQKGSSAMPHKRNPVLCENICGLARLVRGYIEPAFENIQLWHERDISHSSVERVILPDISILVDFMIHRMIRILKGLVVYPKRMLWNVEKARGVFCSEKVMLKLVEHGASKSEAYQIVQELSFRCMEEGIDFQKLLEEDKRVRGYLSLNEIKECFDLKGFTKEIHEVIRRLNL